MLDVRIIIASGVLQNPHAVKKKLGLFFYSDSNILLTTSSLQISSDKDVSKIFVVYMELNGLRRFKVYITSVVSHTTSS